MQLNRDLCLQKQIIMFSKISWQTYGTAVLILTVLYYLVVFLICRKSLSIRDRSEKRLQHPKVAPTLFPREIKQPSGQEIIQQLPPVLPMVHDLVDELSALIRQAAFEQTGKDTLSHSVTAVLKKYPSLYESSYQTSVSNLIAHECETHCNIHFSAEEIRQLW